MILRVISCNRLEQEQAEVEVWCDAERAADPDVVLQSDDHAADGLAGFGEVLVDASLCRWIWPTTLSLARPHFNGSTYQELGAVVALGEDVDRAGVGRVLAPASHRSKAD